MAMYETLQVSPSTLRIGAEISGIDLTRPLGDQQFSELHDAMTRYQVLFFRDQPIDHDSHKALGRLFGPLAIHSGVAGLVDHPEIVAIHADADSKYVAGENWHSDLTCNAEPPMGSILYIKQCPPRGGDTLFANMYAAYDALSDRMKAYLEGLTARHNGEHYRGQYANYGVKDKETYPSADHPIVRSFFESYVGGT